MLNNINELQETVQGGAIKAMANANHAKIARVGHIATCQYCNMPLLAGENVLVSYRTGHCYCSRYCLEQGTLQKKEG